MIGLIEVVVVALLLTNECGSNKQENIAIASTVYNRAEHNSLSIFEVLHKEHQYHYRVKKVIARLKERGCKSFYNKLNYAIFAYGKGRKPYNHYCALYVFPKWSSGSKTIGKHKFKTIK